MSKTKIVKRKKASARHIRQVRKAAAAASVAARWGEARGKSKQVRVDEDAFAALQRVPEKDRRRVASFGVAYAVEEYERQGSVTR